MFCENCGTKLSVDSAFCTNCGKPVKVENAQKSKEKGVDNTVILNVKPTFKIGYFISSYFAIFIIISAMFLPILIVPNMIDLFFTLVAGVAAFVIVIMLISLIITKKQYAAYNYEFYKTKVVYSDSFINLSEKEVKYKHIREVVLRRGFFERWFNLGSITLYTNAETGYTSGISMHSLENSVEIYKTIKELIDEE